MPFANLWSAAGVDAIGVLLLLLLCYCSGHKRDEPEADGTTETETQMKVGNALGALGFCSMGEPCTTNPFPCGFWKHQSPSKSDSICFPLQISALFVPLASPYAGVALSFLCLRLPSGEAAENECRPAQQHWWCRQHCRQQQQQRTSSGSRSTWIR